MTDILKQTVKEYEALDAQRPALEADLDQALRDKETARQCDAKLTAASINLSQRLRDIEDNNVTEVLTNLECDLQGCASRTAEIEYQIKKLDQWHEKYATVVFWRWELAVQNAEVSMLEINARLADYRVKIAEMKLAEDTAAVNQEHGGVAVVSKLVISLRAEAALLHHRYESARAEFKDAVKRQEQRAQVLASHGMITRANVGRAI